jgi:hypothetical protein
VKQSEGENTSYERVVTFKCLTFGDVALGREQVEERERERERENHNQVDD